MVKIILHHLGLGDQIMLNGMVRHFAETDTVCIFCKKCHLESVEFMYRDISEKVKVIPLETTSVSEIQEKIRTYKNATVIPLATYGMDDASWSAYTKMTNWAHGVYLQAKVNPSYMYTKFKVERDRSIEIGNSKECDWPAELWEKVDEDMAIVKDYIFVHDDPERDRYIHVKSDLHIYKPHSKLIDKKQELFQCEHPNIFAYVSLIERAKEVHCMNSSYNWMIELMKLGDKTKNNFHVNVAHTYYTPDIVKTVFSDSMWTFV